MSIAFDESSRSSDIVFSVQVACVSIITFSAAAATATRLLSDVLLSSISIADDADGLLAAVGFFAQPLRADLESMPAIAISASPSSDLEKSAFFFPHLPHMPCLRQQSYVKAVCMIVKRGNREKWQNDQSARNVTYMGMRSLCNCKEHQYG